MKYEHHLVVCPDPGDDSLPGAWSVPDLCAAYHWPTNAPGGGILAIVQVGGGWVQSDMEAYFASIHQPVPVIVDVSVDETSNNPNQHLGKLPDLDREVAMDIQIAAASYFVATGKPAVVRVYWCQEIPSAVEKAGQDGCDVCSISWGASESIWTTEGALEMEAVAAAATEAGMVIVSAAGDHNSSDGGDTPTNVNVPASCPHVIGCGGTTKTATSETVWNSTPGNPYGSGTGGGFSKVFPAQLFQVGAPDGAGRMVPDIAANADPTRAYEFIVHGRVVRGAGTSAAAPLCAGLFAAVGTKLGFIAPTLWSNSHCFNDITSGDNGYYRAGPGPDPCTGLGSPIGVKITSLFVRGLEEGAEDRE